MARGQYLTLTLSRGNLKNYESSWFLRDTRFIGFSRRILLNKNMLWHSYSTKLKQGVFIKFKDFEPWFRLLLWVTGLHKQRRILWQLFQRVVKMYKSQGLERRNLRFVYTYLKEAYTVVIGVIAKCPYEPKIRVRLGKSGLPLILPGDCRKWILENKMPNSTAVLTILALHRIVPWWPPVDLSTVVDEFVGLSRVLDPSLVRRAKRQLCELAGLKPSYLLKIRSIRSLELRTSSPNNLVSIEGVVEDAFAFFENPFYFVNYVRWCIKLNSFWVLFILSFILFVGFPIFLFRKFRGNKHYLGRITTVYNCAGKTRVIGITNYWVQIALFPLHASIFSLLKKISTDGTFDQMAPLSGLIPGKEYRSYDLSAATDRLPIEVQEQFLASWTSPAFASLWVKMIRFPLSSPVGMINYSVGQPMGAYSSWAMLALTHHSIVQGASSSVNNNYAVLGDDVVVDETCGDNYMSIMTTLGVKISLAKTIISKDYIEFAKRLKTVTGLDRSIIGPGLILAAVRCRVMAILLLAESLNKGLIDKWDAPLRLRKCPGFKSVHLAFGIMALFGVTGMVDRIHAIAPSLEDGKPWYYLTTHTQSPTQVIVASTKILTILKERYDSSINATRQYLENIFNLIWSISLQYGVILGCLKFLCLVFSPFMATALQRGSIFETTRPRYPHNKLVSEYLPILYSQLSEFRITSENSLNRKSIAEMDRTFRRIYPPYTSTQSWQDSPIV